MSDEDIHDRSVFNAPDAISKHGIKYTLADDLATLHNKFGLHLDEHSRDDSWTLPMPARLITDRDRIIRKVEINPDYTIRPEPEDTLAALKKIKD